MIDILSHRVIFPERKYTIQQSSRLLGVHRCTLYHYMKTISYMRPIKSENGLHLMFTGAQLERFRQTHHVKVGRKRKNR
jgi:DNA-binding transcriptional MerR regulator